MNKIDLKQVLKEEQKYVLEYFGKESKKIQCFEYEEKTNTCFEKAELIGFNPGQVIKTVFLYNKKGKFYGFVAPELGTKESPLKFDNQLLKKMFTTDKKKARNLMNLQNKTFPLGMERGTCTPFVLDHYFDFGDGFTGMLDKIFIYDSLELEGKKVDISLGGEGEFFHRVSAHLNYENIYGCLNWKFPGRVEKFTF